VLTLFDFQNQAVDQITTRFLAYLDRRPGRVIGAKVTYVPYYQALASITASGRTVIMAEGVAELPPLLPAKPIVLWLSKGRVVVDQTLANLSRKYSHLLADYQDVQLLADYSRSDVEDESLALIYVATVGTFNQKSKDKSNLRLFRSDIDNADRSTWDALKERMTSDGVRRPLFIVYGVVDIPLPVTSHGTAAVHARVSRFTFGGPRHWTRRGGPWAGRA
jgi:type III restriction enzyme